MRRLLRRRRRRPGSTPSSRRTAARWRVLAGRPTTRARATFTRMKRRRRRMPRIASCFEAAHGYRHALAVADAGNATPRGARSSRATTVWRVTTKRASTAAVRAQPRALHASFKPSAFRRRATRRISTAWRCAASTTASAPASAIATIGRFASARDLWRVRAAACTPAFATRRVRLHCGANGLSKSSCTTRATAAPRRPRQNRGLAQWTDTPRRGAADTCFDGTRNGDERGVDCGGGCDARCAEASRWVGPQLRSAAPAGGVLDLALFGGSSISAKCHCDPDFSGENCERRCDATFDGLRSPSSSGLSEACADTARRALAEPAAPRASATRATSGCSASSPRGRAAAIKAPSTARRASAMARFAARGATWTPARRPWPDAAPTRITAPPSRCSPLPACGVTGTRRAGRRRTTRACGEISPRRQSATSTSPLRRPNVGPRLQARTSTAEKRPA